MRTRAAGTYQYWNAQLLPMNNSFTKYVGSWKQPTDTSIVVNGTASAKLLLLPSYSLHNQSGVEIKDNAERAKTKVWLSLFGLERKRSVQ